MSSDDDTCDPGARVYPSRLRRRYPVARIKGGWTQEEDAALTRLIAAHGPGNWSGMARLLNITVGSSPDCSRIGKQCRERYNHHLRPDIRKEAWTPTEEETIVEGHKQHGNHWSEISQLLAGRTENGVKNHWNATLRRKDVRVPESVLRTYQQQLAAGSSGASKPITPRQQTSKGTLAASHTTNEARQHHVDFALSHSAATTSGLKPQQTLKSASVRCLAPSTAGLPLFTDCTSSQLRTVQNIPILQAVAALSGKKRKPVSRGSSDLDNEQEDLQSSSDGENFERTGSRLRALQSVRTGQLPHEPTPDPHAVPQTSITGLPTRGNPASQLRSTAGFPTEIKRSAFPTPSPVVISRNTSTADTLPRSNLNLWRPFQSNSCAAQETIVNLSIAALDTTAAAPSTSSRVPAHSSPHSALFAAGGLPLANLPPMLQALSTQTLGFLSTAPHYPIDSGGTAALTAASSPAGSEASYSQPLGDSNFPQPPTPSSSHKATTRQYPPPFSQPAHMQALPFLQAAHVQAPASCASLAWSLYTNQASTCTLPPTSSALLPLTPDACAALGLGSSGLAFSQLQLMQAAARSAVGWAATAAAYGAVATNGATPDNWMVFGRCSRHGSTSRMLPGEGVGVCGAEGGGQHSGSKVDLRAAAETLAQLMHSNSAQTVPPCFAPPS